MKTLRKLVQSGSNATVRIDVPVSGSLRQFEVVVVWQEVEPEVESQWPQGWIDATAVALMTPPSFAIHRVSTRARKPVMRFPARYERLHRVPHGPLAHHRHEVSLYTSERCRPMQCREGRAPVWGPEEQSG